MKLKNIIRCYFLRQSEQELNHINTLQKQILRQIAAEKELNHLLDDQPRSSNRFHNFFHLFRLPMAILCLSVIFINIAIILNPKVSASSTVVDVLSGIKIGLLRQLNDLLTLDENYRDKTGQRYKQAQKAWCLSSAGPPEKQEKAAAVIREFLDKPDADVNFECTRNPQRDAKQNLTTEMYLAGGYRFFVDTRTDQLVGIELIGSTGQQDQPKKLDTNLSPVRKKVLADIESAEKLVRELVEHKKDVFGELNLATMNLEMSTKTEHDFSTYFLTWKSSPQTRNIDSPYKACSVDISLSEAETFDENGLPCVFINKNTFTPQVSFVIDQQAIIIHFSNELDG
ncbi:MAG: hypothetical protein ACOZAN_02445 [Patescibacteria group bacterium]